MSLHPNLIMHLLAIRGSRPPRAPPALRPTSRRSQRQYHRAPPGGKRQRVAAWDSSGTPLACRLTASWKALAATPADDDTAAAEAEALRQQLVAAAGGETDAAMTGEELREIVVDRWGKPYDTRITQRRDRYGNLRLYVQVMWKFLGQKSFPLSEQQYADQLEAVADLLNEWGVAEQVRRDIAACEKSPVLHNAKGKSVMIPLDTTPAGG